MYFSDKGTIYIENVYFSDIVDVIITEHTLLLLYIYNLI